MANQKNSIPANDYKTLSPLEKHQEDNYIGTGAKQRGASRSKNMPELIGAIDQGTSSTRFLVFENQTGHLIASSQMEIKRITPQEGWVEIDPSSIMSSVHATIANVYDQLTAHYNLPVDNAEQFIPSLLSCIGICNQRESAVVWDSQTGQPLYNVIVWMDNRTKYIVDEMIDSIPGRDFNRFKDKTGLPMSTYFSAFKLKWLMDNVAEVKLALKEKRLLFGTVDSWILWNLTGGKHLTDVTNASRTFLMDIETLQWDKSLCKHFKVPINILPVIRASADDFGQVQVGPFTGTPITGVIGDQSAALFGHNCLQLGQTKATFGTGCFIMQNIGPGPLNGALSGVHRDAKRGLVTTVGYKLGNRPACYALEGSVKIAGAALTWLRDNIQLIQNYEECDLLVNETTHSAGVFFVPAFGGLYSPYWDPNATGVFLGLSQFTRREHLVRSTFDSIAYQTNDILSLMRGVANGLMIDGGLCKSDNLCQILADITGYDITRPSMCETSALGAAMVAGYGAGLWSYESMLAHSNEPLEASLNFTSHTHHYPHECLNYDDKHAAAAKQHSHSQESSDSFRARTKSVTSNEAAACHIRSNVEQSRAALVANRQRFKSANGVNYDAGGGEEGDRGGGEQTRIQEDEDAQSAISSSQIATSMATTNTTDFYPSVAENSQINPLESSLESSGRQEQTILGDFQVVSSAVVNGAMAPSSGYSSSDNFDQTTTLSGVSVHGRVYTPVSQITEGNTSHSATPCMDLNGCSSVAVVRDSICDSPPREVIEDNLVGVSSNTDEDDTEDQGMGVNEQQHDKCRRTKIQKFPFNLKNFFAQQPQVLETTSLNAIGGKLCSERRHNVEDEADEQGDEDLVHEFGGRDSYGEDGYDSPSAGLDSYASENDEIEPDYDFEQPLSMIATENDHLDDNSSCEPIDTSNSQKDCKQTATLARFDRHRASRQRRSSALSKQIDVFQPYISIDHRTDLVETWRRAVERSMQWTKVHHEEIKRIDYQRLSSLPISMYLFFSIGMVALSSILSESGSLSAFAPKG